MRFRAGDLLRFPASRRNTFVIPVGSVVQRSREGIGSGASSMSADFSACTEAAITVWDRASAYHGARKSSWLGSSKPVHMGKACAVGHLDDGAFRMDNN